MAKPRLLIIHPGLAPYRIDLFNALNARFELKLLVLMDNVAYQPFDQKALLARLDFAPEYARRKLMLMGKCVPLGLGRLIRSFKPDTVVTHEFAPMTAMVAALRLARGGFRHLVWSADNVHTPSRDSLGRKVARRLLLGRADGLIVYSPEVASLYRGRFGFRGPIALSPNVQSEAAIRAAAEAALPLGGEIARRHGLIGRKPVICVGRLARVKRVDRVLQAFAAVRADEPRAVLLVLGEGAELEPLRRQTAQLGVERDVVFAGHVEGPALWGWMGCARVLALASEFEPWGAVVDEALACGLRVLCSRDAGAAGLVQDGVNGRVVDAADPDAMRHALAGLLADAAPLGPADGVKEPLIRGVFDRAVAQFAAVCGEAGHS